MRVRLVIVVCGALAAAAVALAVFHDLLDGRRQAEDAHVRRIQSTSRLLGEHAARTLGEITQVLRRARSAVGDHPAYDQAGNSEIRDLLRGNLSAGAVVTNILVAAADGRVLHDARQTTGTNGMAAVPPAPALAGGNAGDQPVIVAAPPSAGAGTGVLSISLPVVDIGGRARGFVVATVPISYFDAVYASAQDDQESAVTLWRRDGEVLLRHPPGGEEGSRPGLRSHLFGPEPARASSGTLRVRATDGRIHVAAWRSVAGWPVVVSVSALESADLAAWRSNAIWRGVGGGIGVVIILVLTALLARHVERLDQAQADAASFRQRLGDAIDSLPDAFILFDRDDRLVAVNQKYREYFPNVSALLVPGSTYEQILRVGLQRGAYPDAAGHEEEWLARRLRSHRQPGPPFEQGLADGRWFRISERRTGEGGIVGVRVDITERKRAERALRDSERHAQAIMDSTLDGLVVIDATGTIERINGAVRTLFGYEAEALIGHNMKVLVDEGSRPKLDAHFARCRDAEKPAGGGLEITGRRRDGTTFPVDVVIGALTIDGDRRYIGAIRDISDRVGMQAMLREAIDSTSDGFVYFGADGRLVVCNQKYLDAYDYLKEVPRIEGITFEEIVRLGLERNYVADPLVRRDPEAWVRLRMEQHRSPPEHPVLRQLSDGRWLLVSDRRTPSGGLVGTRTDVTERIRTEQALRDSERRFRLLMNAARDYAIIMLDRDGNVASWNEGARLITGYEESEIIGRPRDTLRPASVAPTAAADALRIARETGRYAARERRMRKDGTEFWADVVISRIDDDQGMPAGFAKIMHDVSESIAIEEQLAQAQKMEAVGQLSGGLAHDFNNLLQVVITNLELLLDRKEPDDAVRTRIRDALGAAERGAELTAQMLAFGRRQTLTPRPTDLKVLVEDLASLVRRTLGATIAVDLRLAFDLRDAMIDRAHLETAILNLVLNARDAMPGGGRVSIAADNVELDEAYVRQHPEARRGRYVAITIGDTGEGMSDAVLAHAIEPFFTTKEIGKGSGLGLSMVYGFIKQSGGHVQLDSAPGRGTKVTLYLPEARAEESTASVAESAPVALGELGTILVVEDNHDVRRLAVSLLEGMGFNVLQASDGAQALSILEGDLSIALLLTDVMLAGGMSGPDVAREAGLRRPGIKLAYMSGYAGGDGGHVELDPAVTFIGKPFTRAAFARGIRAALGT